MRSRVRASSFPPFKLRAFLEGSFLVPDCVSESVKKQDNTEKGNWGETPEIKGSLEQFRVSEKSDMSDVASIYVL